MRLDKLLSQSGERSRTEAAKLIRAGRVTADGATVRDPSAHVAETASVLLDGEPIQAQGFQYLLYHKPAGVLTAARDRHAPTVMDDLPEAARRRDVLPVGRLDKDTTGLLLLTNDGELAHRLLSPKRHVWKRYVATVSGRLKEEDAQAFESGLTLSDFVAKPAKLRIVSAEDEQSVAEVELREGKFHQVKRMFLALGHEVLTLHRDRFGTLSLDVPERAYRPLSDTELSALRESVALEEKGTEDG